MDIKRAIIISSCMENGEQGRGGRVGALEGNKFCGGALIKPKFS